MRTYNNNIEEANIVKVTIIVTVYNEIKTIIQAIDDVRTLNVEKEIIVIDNCSTDGTRELLRSIEDDSFKVVFQDKNYGFGKSIETGISLAKGEYIFVQFSDLEYDHTKCIDMIRLAENNNYDAVFGSRIKDILKTRSRWSLIKERPACLASVISTYLVNRWYGYNFTDIIGAKLYRTSSVKKIQIDTYGMGFEFEHVSKMCRRRFRIGEVNIDYWPRTNSKEKKIKPYHMLNAVWAMFKVKFLELPR
jgi:glycosyltransferase involved in cell wall biosynthesis